jgi:hypothetical protein
MVINDLDIDRAGRALKLYASRKAQFEDFGYNRCIRTPSRMRLPPKNFVLRDDQFAAYGVVRPRWLRQRD